MPPAGLTSDNGALLVGVVIANMWAHFPSVGALLDDTRMCGVTTHQTVSYLSRFHDAIEVKLWVYGTWLLNTATTCIYTKVAYTYYINHFNDPLYQIFEDNCVAVASIMTGSTVFLVQSFFIMRVWKLLERSWYTVALITFFIVLALYALSSSAAITYLTVKRTDRAMVLDALLRSNVVVETALDIFLTVSLVYTLQKHRTEFCTTANRFDRLMVFLATRGILMTAYQAVVIILTNVITLTFVTAAFQIMLATVYTSSMLFTLNSRKSESHDSECLQQNLTTARFAVPAVSTHEIGGQSCETSLSRSGQCYERSSGSSWTTKDFPTRDPVNRRQASRFPPDHSPSD